MKKVLIALGLVTAAALPAAAFAHTDVSIGVGLPFFAPAPVEYAPPPPPPVVYEQPAYGYGPPVVYEEPRGYYGPRYYHYHDRDWERERWERDHYYYHHDDRPWGYR